MDSTQIEQYQTSYGPKNQRSIKSFLMISRLAQVEQKLCKGEPHSLGTGCTGERKKPNSHKKVQINVPVNRGNYNQILQGAWTKYERTGDQKILWKHGDHSNTEVQNKKVSRANDVYYIITSRIFEKSENTLLLR